MILPDLSEFDMVTVEKEVHRSWLLSLFCPHPEKTSFINNAWMGQRIVVIHGAVCTRCGTILKKGYLDVSEDNFGS